MARTTLCQQTGYPGFDRGRGACQKPFGFWHRIDELLAGSLEVLPFTLEDAVAAGAVRAYLANQGTQIGPFDVLIAGQAKARDLPIVTANTKEFERVPGLEVRNWQVP